MIQAAQSRITAPVPRPFAKLNESLMACVGFGVAILGPLHASPATIERMRGPLPSGIVLKFREIPILENAMIPDGYIAYVGGGVPLCVPVEL